MMSSHPDHRKGGKSRHPGGGPPQLDFDCAPFLVIWEVTQACDLACVHCRAEAQQARHPLELSTSEGFHLLEEIRRFGRPLFILTGGDPLKRPDIFDLISYAKSIGLSPALSPSGTPLLNRENLTRAAQAGVQTVSISIDAPTAQEHDRFRGVDGSFDLSIGAARIVRELGLRLQINTTITPHNQDRLDQMGELVEDLDAARWEVFFLVPTGRGRELTRGSAQKYEEVAHWLFDHTESMNAHITAVEAPFYRRVVLQRLAEEQGSDPAEIFQQSRTGYGRFLPAINSGSGFVFISHRGNIFPSGFLPAAAGNVRSESLVDVYRDQTLFRELRNQDLLKGRCGRCEYRALCGGSRARAYALTGDHLQSDPFCTYQPNNSETITTRQGE